MKIISKTGNEYYCKVIDRGWAYARPSVAVKKTYKHWLTRKEIEYFEQVSVDNPWEKPVTVREIEEAGDNFEIIKWFHDAVEYYESKQFSYQSKNDRELWVYE